MIDFSELPDDGQQFELLIRELLFRKGFSVYWSGKGADGGRDLICIERRGSFFLPDEKRWLIQCKHNAHSRKSVGIGDLDNIVDSCQHHQCHGYLLACTTHPSSGVVQRLESITNNPQTSIVATYWDAVKIEHVLSTPTNWPLAQKFFPISANAESWQVYATENPNHWVINYKGYYFHLLNRIGSNKDHHFGSIKRRIDEIENIALPQGHFIRPRSVYYDDKNGGYTWYLDYMYPNNQRPVIGTAEIANYLGDGYALEDGQIYHFDVLHRSYFKHSDHYDPDHYDYYQRDSESFRYGIERNRDYEDHEEAEESKRKLKEKEEAERTKGFDVLVASLNQLSFLKIVRSCNAQIEDLDRFHIRRNWSEVIEKLELEQDRFFSAWFLLSVNDDEKFHELITFFPQEIEKHFRLTKPYIYIPADGREGCVCDDGYFSESLYELTVSIHPSCIGNKITGRSLLNEYFLAISQAVDSYVKQPDRA